MKRPHIFARSAGALALAIAAISLNAFAEGVYAPKKVQNGCNRVHS